MEHITGGSFHDKLKLKAHQYVKEVYKITKNFSHEELYGITSQLRRAAMSVILNYIEGYARRRGDNCKVYQNFLETAYGSLKESKYLIFFSFSENYINKLEYEKLSAMADEIGRMVWSIMN
ncbi:MAG: four helix bundle protein [Candidatus Gracilibacteria bacterium]